MKSAEMAQITAPMARFVSGLARDATLYYAAAERLQRLCDAVGIDGIDDALKFGHVNELADFVALYGRLPTSFEEMVAYRIGVEIFPQDKTTMCLGKQSGGVECGHE